jgi:S1-C subfamily serine protease
MRKIKVGILLSILMLFLMGCDALFSAFFWPTSVTSTTLPLTINGTITVENDDYIEYSDYASSTYDLTDIEDYNNVLFHTKDLIRASNIQITVTLYETTYIFPGRTGTEIVGTSNGSGVIFKQDNDNYFALTNFHVIDNKDHDSSIEILAFGDTVSSVGEVVCFDEELDLAVVSFPKNSRTGIHLIDYTTRLYKKFNPGELVMAVGNPLGVENNVTFGEYVRLVLLQNEDIYSDFNVIEHTASINFGSSGGALVDVDGALLGINTWGTENNIDQSLAIPVAIVYMFLVNYDQI